MGLAELEQDGDGNGDGTERENAVRIERNGGLRGEALAVFELGEVAAAALHDQARDEVEAHEVGFVDPHEGRGERSLHAAEALVVKIAAAVGEDQFGVFVGALDVEQVVDRHEFDASRAAHGDGVRRGRGAGRRSQLDPAEGEGETFPASGLRHEVEHAGFKSAHRQFPVVGNHDGLAAPPGAGSEEVEAVARAQGGFHEHDIVGRDAHGERPQHHTRSRIEFEQLIREIRADVEPRAVGRQREPTRNLLFAPRRIRERQREAMRRPHLAVVAHREDLDATGIGRVRHAIEVRNTAFATPGFVAQLRRHNVALVVADTADWPYLDQTADFAYLRLQGAPGKESYSTEERDARAGWLKALADGAAPDGPYIAGPETTPVPRDVHGFFVSTDKEHAPDNARAVMATLGLVGPGES